MAENTTNHVIKIDCLLLIKTKSLLRMLLDLPAIGVWSSSFNLKKSARSMRIKETTINTPATKARDSSLTNSCLLTTEMVNPASIHPTVPAAPIRPIHFLDSVGFSTPTAIPQNKTMGRITIVSQSM